MAKLAVLVATSVAIAFTAGCSTPPPSDAETKHLMAPAFFGNGVLVSPGGMTLYTYDHDSQGTSTCDGTCTQTWTPFAPAATDQPFGDFTIVAREDGSRQWAYKGKPVYMYTLDHVMGDTAGDGRDNAWHLVRAGT
jgi:predicted lipoprotein with Yx(FWY)xxD motif